MIERPGPIDLQSKHPDSFLVPPQLSPRTYYNNGEIPPSMSPLDAFAAQSRLLAQQLDLKNADKRMSRLPPAMVNKSLSQHRADRPSVFRSLSQESSGTGRLEEGTASSPTLAISHERHLSQHPRISGLPPNTFDPEERDHDTPVDHRRTSTNTTQIRTSLDYFGLPRTASPAPSVATAESTTGHIALHNTHTSSKPSRQQPLSRNDSAKSQQLDPMSAFSPPRFVPRQESSDDDYTSSVAGSSFSFPRKLSSSSGVSVPYSPLSPTHGVYPPRSPSIASEASGNAVHAPRAPWNFSRPRSTASMSLASRPHSPALSASNVTSQSISVERKVSAPVKMPSRESPEDDGYLSGGGPSYTYAKFTLPRGRDVSRDSMVFQGLSTPTFEWEGPIFENSPVPEPKTSSERPKTAPSSNRRQTLDPGRNPLVSKDADFPTGLRAASFDAHKRDFKPSAPPPAIPTFRTTVPAPSQPPTFPLPSRPAPPIPSSPTQRSSTETSRSQKADPEDGKSLSGTSASTIRPTSLKHTASSASKHYLTPEEHVTKGIECHESGSLQESTYHLRIAAMQNHPTAMLLYALACRHGWGMRANQREGVQWLRKALDSAEMEVREDETEGSRDTHDKKTHRAQFALSIYELGVSHLNGWGIEQDKTLALRCFEIAAHWGDSDAMTEAGFCYVEGIGCKKDMRTAAKYYRMAEAKGVSMVGNSWIYKDKYNEPANAAPSRGLTTRAPTFTSIPPEKKARDKSRTRSIFGRRKSERTVAVPLPS